MKKQFVFLAAAAIALIGCKPRQSELSLDSIRDTATITGHVTYTIGQQSDSTGYVTELQIPAEGKTVYLDIPYASYSSGASGVKTFSGVVDNAGNYTLSIPVPAVGVSGASLRFEEFTAEQSLFQRMENGEPVFEKRMCKFTVEGVPALPNPLKPEHVYVKDLCYSRTVIDMKDYAETAILTGSLLLPYETKFRTGAYKAAADCQFEITIQDGEDFAKEGPSATEFTYGTTTNAKGEFTIELPIKNLKKGFRVSNAVVTPKTETTFTHFVNETGKKEQLSGVYKLRESLSLLNVSEVVAGVSCNIGARPLEFLPGYNNDITAAPQTPATWQRNLAGWVFAESQFANFQASATIKGAVALAAEKSFGVGEFVTTAQTVTVRGTESPFDQGFVVLTNADGSFELTIPAAQDGQHIGGAWTASLNQPATIAFTHYAKADKQLVLSEGSYNQYKKVRAVDAAWNELGKTYYRFAPANTPDTWCADLAGWVIVPDYEETATVKAKLQFPVETGYCVGTYKGASVRAKLTMNYPDGAVTFVAPVAADGTFQVNIPVKTANSTMNADNISLFDNKTDEFKHYLASKVEVLEGQYSLRNKIEAENGTWNNKWTIYYTFAPTSVATDYTTDLLGWVPKPEGWAEQVQWTSTIMMPVETGFWRGAYEPLAGKKVQVSYTVNGTSFKPVVKTDAQGVVTCPIYLQYGLETPSINIKVFEEEMVHYYNPKNAEATTTLEGSYAIRLRTPQTATWDAERTYYMQFNPDASVQTTLLSWTNNIAEWYVLDNKKDNATIKLYAQKAIESTTSKSHEAAWTTADKMKATINIYNAFGSFIATVDRQVSGQNINFTLPMSEAIESGVTELKFTVKLENETSNNTAFTHYADPASDTKTTLLGNYRSANNLKKESATANGKTFEVKQSAKALFYEAGSYSTPSGYNWSAILSDEI